MATGPSTVELLVRLVFSLGVIVGLLLLGTKVLRRNGGALRLPGLAGLGRRQPAIKVLERQSLTRSASLAMVQVGARTMVVGITEHGVSLLADDLPGDEPEPEPEPEPAAEPEPDRRPIDLDLDLTERPSRMSLVDALRELTVRKP